MRLSRIGMSLAVAILFAGGLPASAPAQVRIPAEALESEAQLQAVLQTGSDLERQGRWGEALSHYEEAVRNYPERADLEQRLTLARFHYDLGRRYADRSYTGTLPTMSEADALEVYRDVLLKIQTYYVHTPDWKEHLSRGTQALEVALADEIFRKTNLPQVAPERIDAFRNNLRRNVDWRPSRTRQEASDAALWVGRYAQQQLGLSPTATILEYACGTAGSLDLYSTFLTGAQLDDVYSQIEGNFVGLGIELKADQGSLLIVNVLAGGSAHGAGIQGGDRIISVSGMSTQDISTDKAADLLKGDEGTTVDVVVQDVAGNRRSLRLARRRVEVPSVEDVKMVDPQMGVGYMKLTSFQKTTSRDVDAALWKLHRDGMRSLIIDVRGNPGGLLTASVEVADKFVTDGTIVATRGRSPREDFDYKAHRIGTWNVPLVVLIDGDSASASEIFAGAIRDHRRGKVVGQRSYGKGSVQGIFPLSVSKSGIRLTTAKFYSPSGQAISDRGVSPDIVVRTVAKPVIGDNPDVAPAPAPAHDASLEAGLQAARHLMTSR